MQPGPVTAAALALGSSNRYAGLLLAAGHAVIELPLMIAIILGLDEWFKNQSVQIAVGLGGGIFLLVMAVQAMLGLRTRTDIGPSPSRTRPFLAGVILTASNPYFLLWWATVGLALAAQAKLLGIFAFVLFALVHWSVDLLWLHLLSWASFKGSIVFGGRSRRIIMFICSIALLFFGVFFIFNSLVNLRKLM